MYLLVRADVADGQFHAGAWLPTVVIQNAHAARNEAWKKVFQPRPCALIGVGVEVYKGVAGVVLRRRRGGREDATEIFNVVEFKEAPHLFKVGGEVALEVAAFELIVFGITLPRVE